MRKEREFNLFIYIITLLAFPILITMGAEFGKRYLDIILILPLMYQINICHYSKSRKNRVSRIEDIHPYFILVVDLILAAYFYNTGTVILYMAQACLIIDSWIYLLKDAGIIQNGIFKYKIQYMGVFVISVCVSAFILNVGYLNSETTISQASILSVVYMINMYLLDDEKHLENSQDFTEKSET